MWTIPSIYVKVKLGTARSKSVFSPHETVGFTIILSLGRKKILSYKNMDHSLLPGGKKMVKFARAHKWRH
jgi:hypothetical protein